MLPLWVHLSICKTWGSKLIEGARPWRWRIKTVASVMSDTHCPYTSLHMALTGVWFLGWYGLTIWNWFDLMYMVPIRRLLSSFSPCTRASARRATSLVTSTWRTKQKIRACYSPDSQTEAEALLRVIGGAPGARPTVWIKSVFSLSTCLPGGHHLPNMGAFARQVVSQISSL